MIGFQLSIILYYVYGARRDHVIEDFPFIIYQDFFIFIRYRCHENEKSGKKNPSALNYLLKGEEEGLGHPLQVTVLNFMGDLSSLQQEWGDI
jgi:hypothetical protein